MQFKSTGWPPQARSWTAARDGDEATRRIGRAALLGARGNGEGSAPPTDRSLRFRRIEARILALRVVCRDLDVDARSGGRQLPQPITRPSPIANRSPGMAFADARVRCRERLRRACAHHAIEDHHVVTRVARCPRAGGEEHADVPRTVYSHEDWNGLRSDAGCARCRDEGGHVQHTPWKAPLGFTGGGLEEHG